MSRSQEDVCFARNKRILRYVWLCPLFCHGFSNSRCLASLFVGYTRVVYLDKACLSGRWFGRNGRRSSTQPQGRRPHLSLCLSSVDLCKLYLVLSQCQWLMRDRFFLWLSHTFTITKTGFFGIICSNPVFYCRHHITRSATLCALRYVVTLLSSSFVC